MASIAANISKIPTLGRLPRYALAVVMGVLATGALPPLFHVSVLLIVFPVLLLLLQGCKTPWQAFLTGWCFAFAHHVTGLYWISNALLVDPTRFAWMIPFAVSLIPAYVALYGGIVCWLTWKSKLQGRRYVLLFAALWTLGEIVRAYALTGFPWNLIGYVWGDTLPVLRLAAWIGVYGLTLVTVLTASLPALFFMREGKKSETILLCFVVLAFWAIAVPLAGATKGEKDTATLRVRIVQPNIPQTMKWDILEAQRTLMEHVNLTHTSPRDPRKPPQVVVWPEAALPYRLEGNDPLKALIAGGLAPGAVLITGAVRGEKDKDGANHPHNSIFAMEQHGVVLGIYDKHHLVPFGEYVPLHDYLPFVDKITQGGMDFVAGAGPTTFSFEDAVPKQVETLKDKQERVKAEISGKPAKSAPKQPEIVPPVSPLICYEAIFSGQVNDKKHPPSWMVNVTNDAWYGDSPGPYQHYTMSRTRAVEEGIPLVRSANTGISAAFGAHGEVLGALKLGQRGILDVEVPYHLSVKPETLYARFGVFIPLLLIVACLLMVVL